MNAESPHVANHHVGLFVTCLVDLYRPAVGFAALRLLQQAGCQVSVPRSQTCCGQPAYSHGDYRTAAAVARQVIAAFEPFDYVLAPSASCIGMLQYYPRLFAGDDAWRPRAEALAERSHELLSFLTDVCGVRDTGAACSGSATCHDSCSALRQLDIHEQPRQLLRSVRGLQLREMQDADTCCGFGGTFCVRYADISGRMVADKAEHILATGADMVVGGDFGCLLNIAGRLKRLGQPVRVYHTAEVLAGMHDTPAIGDGDHD